MSSEESQFSSIEGPQAALLRELSQLSPEAGFSGSKILPLEGRTETEPPFRGLLDSLPAAIYTTDAAGRITFYNEAAVALWGCRPQLGKSEWCGSWRLYWPDGSAMPHDQCPMAMALKEGRPIRGMDAVAERPDGSRVHFLPYPTPLYDEAGALVGAVNMLVDITDRWRADEIGQRLASIVESSDDSIVSTDSRGMVTSWNRGAERLFGYAAAEMIGRSVTAMIPGDRRDEELRILERIRLGERIDHYETVRRRKDGSLVEVSLTVSPIRSVNGKIIGASKIARDITDRKRAQERQTLLLREMNHRVKNLFALASGVVALSARTARAPENIAEAVRQRLAALSRAHELTLLDIGGGENLAERATTLHALVRTIVAPYSDPERGHDERVVIEGVDVPVGGSAVTSVALLLHEFATNATKYGALSSPEGRVDVRWSVQDGELRLTWTEQGGPPLAGPPEGEGFGSLLARTTMSAQFGGRISRDWRSEGLVAQLVLPIERLAR